VIDRGGHRGGHRRGHRGGHQGGHRRGHRRSYTCVATSRAARDIQPRVDRSAGVSVSVIALRSSAHRLGCHRPISIGGAGSSEGLIKHACPVTSRPGRGAQGPLLPTTGGRCASRDRRQGRRCSRTEQLPRLQGNTRRRMAGPDCLYAHAAFQEIDEVAFALPFNFDHDDYVQILTDLATNLGPALGWAPSH
jgi:hypothetical protein